MKHDELVALMAHGILCNYAPKSADDVPASAFVLHFRGKRKAWMIERYQP